VTTPTPDINTSPAIVVGASRGLGRGIATALARTRRPVIAVARSAGELTELADEVGNIRAEVADATDPSAAGRLIERYEPEVIVLVAGAIPQMRSLQDQTWETFSVNWETDVRMAFHWLRAALLTPLQPSSRVVVLSSGAATNPNGSPLSGGYAGAKATQSFVAAYAQSESDRAGLHITFTTVLPHFAPLTGVGKPAVAAYAARASLSVEEFLAARPFPPLSPQIAGDAIVELLQAETADLSPSYMLHGGGLLSTRKPVVDGPGPDLPAATQDRASS
jgi:NAD(P)-dependent dehydrogenase (short-subunit alcohol dehydrogenase family)